MTEKSNKQKENKLKKEAEKFKKHLISKMLTLSTSAFGLIAALAWNELIKEFVKEYIKPLFGESSGIISLLIYAVFITVLAVFVTYQLSKLERKD